MCSVVQNPHFDSSEFGENARQCIIFSITICTFYPARYFTCISVHKSAFFHEFHAPHASETPVLCFPNVLGLKSSRNCRFQPKTRDFLQKLHVFVKYVSRNPRHHVSCVLLFKMRTLIFRNLPKTHVNVSYSP